RLIRRRRRRARTGRRSWTAVRRGRDRERPDERRREHDADGLEPWPPHWSSLVGVTSSPGNRTRLYDACLIKRKKRGAEKALPVEDVDALGRAVLRVDHTHDPEVRGARVLERMEDEAREVDAGAGADRHVRVVLPVEDALAFEHARDLVVGVVVHLR